jgi:glycosyltransferase involved in cell wall biosynthesis
MFHKQARMGMMAGPLPGRLKVVHGFGAVAFGVKDGGFSLFLLPFYNLVLGVDAGIVGAALATALIDLLRDPARREQMAAASRAAADGPFSWEAIASQTVRLYAR